MREVRGMVIAEKLARLRARRGRSYVEVGAAARCSGQHVRRIERDGTVPSVSIALGIARLFGVPLDWLADDAADWPPPAVGERQAVVDVVERALESGGLAGELTDTERDVLSALRSLDPVGRAKAAGYVIGLAAGGSSESAAFGADLSAALDDRSSPRAGEESDSPSSQGRAG